MEERKDEFKMFQPTDYQTEMRSLGPDGRIHHLVYNSQTDRYAYVFNKKYTEDASFYSPHLMHTIGKKIGIDVPSTELGIYLEKDVNTGKHMNSFYESSLVYLNHISKFTRFLGNISYVDPEVVQAIYLSENPDKANDLRSKTPGRARPITIDEYILSNIHFITTRGEKSKEEFSEEEIEDMKQELVDRAMFGLKFGIHGKNTIVIPKDRTPRLDSYYLSSSNMFSFNVRDEWIEEQLEKSDVEFKKVVDGECISQYGIPPNVLRPETKQVLNYLYAKYPKQAEKAYEKISTYTAADLEKELNSYTRLNDSKKKFALRVFNVREKEFNEAYKNHVNRNLDEECK